MFVMFLESLINEQTFITSQVKGNVIISNKLLYTSTLTNC